VEDNGGVYFVPAFSGLFAPYWRSDARGAIVGLSRYNTNAHLARATSRRSATRARTSPTRWNKDSGVHVETLKVDGGVTANDLCMQLQADILAVPVSRPVSRDHRLGRRICSRAGYRILVEHRRTAARTGRNRRDGPRNGTTRNAPRDTAGWQKAVQRTLDWVDVD